MYFSQTSEVYFCRGFNWCPYYRGVRNSEVSTRRELAVLFFSFFSVLLALPLCQVNRRLILLPASDFCKFSWGSMPRALISFKTAEVPMLKYATGPYRPISRISRPTNTSFRMRFGTIPFKALFRVWVFSCKHFSSPSQACVFLLQLSNCCVHSFLCLTNALFFQQ